MATDARSHPRFQVEALADVIGDEVVLARPVHDVSLGGCRMMGPATERVGAVVEMVLSFIRLGVNLPIHAKVVRATDRDMTVAFHDSTDEQKWALRKHIREARGQDSEDARWRKPN